MERIEEYTSYIYIYIITSIINYILYSESSSLVIDHIAHIADIVHIENHRFLEGDSENSPILNYLQFFVLGSPTDPNGTCEWFEKDLISN